MSKDVNIKVTPIVDEYLSRGDNASENSNTSWTPNGMLFAAGTEVLKEDYLNRMKDVGFEELVELHRLGGVHIHDLSLGYPTPYCCGHSLSNLLNDGIKSGTITSAPAKHLRSAINHMVNYIGAASNEYAGAQSFSSFDSYLAPYAYKCFLDMLIVTGDIKLSKEMAIKEIKQSIQEFVFHVNYNTRYGSQPPFSNISLDIDIPPDLINKPVMVAGKLLNYWYDTANQSEFAVRYNKDKKVFHIYIDGGDYHEDIVYDFKTSLTYGDIKEWQVAVARAILDVFIEGDANGKGFTFPVLTVNVTEEFFNNPLRNKVYELAGKFGTPYFQNFINGISGRNKIEPKDVRSMCVKYDTRVYVKWNVDDSKERIQIGELLTRYDKDSYKILTSGGYRPVSKTIIQKSDKLVHMKTSDGKELYMTPDHPHLVYGEKGLIIIQAKDLKVGMSISCKKDTSGKNNPNYGNKWSDDMKSKASSDKKDFYKNNPEAKPVGEKNGMFGKKQSDEMKENNSKKLQNHYVSENCRNKSSERWKGLKNPVANQKYWDKKSENDPAHQLSLKEIIIKEFLNSNSIEYSYQKVFYDTNTIHVPDFVIFDKNLIIESESTCNGTFLNDATKMNDKDRFNYFRNLGYDVLITNPEVSNEWIKYVNKTEIITELNIVDHNDLIFDNGLVYDVEIAEELGRSKVHDFYANDILTHNCCRLSINAKEISKHIGGLFGNAEQTGSIQVVTISLPYLAMETKEKISEVILRSNREYYDIIKKVFLNRLLDVMDQIRDEQLWKRKIVEESFEKGLFPISKSNFKRGFDTFYTTVGFIGLWETIQILTDIPESFLDEFGMTLAKEILIFMADTTDRYTQETHKLFNLEATPAESASYKLARKALKSFPDIPHGGCEKTPYFVNSCHLPVEMQNRLDLIFLTQSELQTIPSGGTVTHFYTGEHMSSDEIETVVKVVCETPIPYFSITTVYSMCPICGYVSGNYEFCPNVHTEEQLKNVDPKYIVYGDLNEISI